MAPRGRKARVNPKKKAKDNTPEHKALKELWQHLERSEAQGTNPHHPGWLYQCKRNEKGKISRLDLSESSQISLPASIGTFNSLISINLSKCTCLVRLPDTICGLHALKIILLRKCNNLIALPEAIGELQALVSLELEGCFKLAALPDSISTIPELEIGNWQGSPFPIQIKQLNQEAITLGREVTGSSTIIDVKVLIQERHYILMPRQTCSD